MSVRIDHVDLAVARFEIELGDRPKGRPIIVEDFEVDSGNFDTEASGGMLDLKRKHIDLHVVITLDPRSIPALAEIGFRAPVQIRVTESGRLDLEGGMLDTHAEPFQLPGALRSLRVSAGQFSNCRTSATLCVAASAAGADSSICYKEVWVCPGQEAFLRWSVENADHAEITPDVGQIAVGKGVSKVRPHADTLYTLVADGSGAEMCKRTDEATVRVVDPGRPRTLSAMPDRETGIWSLDVPAATTSPSIMLTSIRAVSCGWGAGFFPHWSVMKTDIDGFVHNFDVTDVPSSPGRFPIAGTWKFVPTIPGGYIPTDNACFEVTQACD